MNTVKCSTHGEGPRAFICQHSLQTLGDHKRRGFKFARDKDGAVNAWCDECHQHLIDSGHTWTAETQEFAGIKIVCESCAAVVAGINHTETTQ